MAAIRRFLVLLLGLGASFSNAQKLHNSCAELKGKNSEGVETNYGEVRGSIAVAIQEAGAIAETARDYMKKAADKTGDEFDITRTVQSFYAFQGERDGDESTSEGRWDTAISECSFVVSVLFKGRSSHMLPLESLERLMNYVENRNTQDPPFLCGDGHLTKFTHYQNGERIQAQDEDGNAFDTYMYFGRPLSLPLLLSPLYSRYSYLNNRRLLRTMVGNRRTRLRR